MEIANRLLRRNAYALAMLKRVSNKQMLASFDLVHDPSLAYEFLIFYMQPPEAEQQGKGRGEDEL